MERTGSEEVPVSSTAGTLSQLRDLSKPRRASTRLQECIDKTEIAERKVLAIRGNHQVIAYLIAPRLLFELLVVFVLPHLARIIRSALEFCIG